MEISFINFLNSFKVDIGFKCYEPLRPAVNSNKNLYIYHISIRFYNC